MGLRGNSGHGGGESGRGVFYVFVVVVLLRKALDDADWAPEFDFR